MKRLVILACLLLLPTAIADHPGSNLGLARYDNPADIQNLVHNVVTVDLQFDEWELAYPGLVERFNLGETEGGLPLHGIVITNENVQPNWTHEGKLKVYLDGGHHGNEYLGVEIIMYYIEELLAQSPANDELLANMEFHIVPILNVEGNLRDTRVNFNGFDVNRNYPLGHVPCSIPGLTCGGPEPFSESEIAANAAYLTQLSPDLWLSMHTGVALLYYNAGEPYIPEAPDQGLFSAMEPLFEAATNGVIDMTGGPAPAVGSADDWGYSMLGTPTFTYEVHEDQFLPAYGNAIPQVLDDQINGLRWLVENTPYLGAWVDLEGSRLVNRGFGNATGLGVQAGDETWQLPALAPGEGAYLPVTGGDVAWSYNALLVDGSRQRYHDAVLLDSQTVPENEASPMFALPLLAAGLLILARRR